MKRKVNIRVFHSDITTHCPRCEKVLFRTEYSIVLRDDENRYIFLSDATRWCCSAEIKIPLGFEDVESAWNVQREILETVRQEGHTKSYDLQEFPLSNASTKH